MPADNRRRPENRFAITETTNLYTIGCTMSEENNTAADRLEEQPNETVREIPLHSLDMRQLIELDACTRCGECLTWCPVYDQDNREALIPRRKVIDFLRIAKTQQGVLAKIMKGEKLSAPLKGMLGRIFGYKQITQAEIDDFVQNIYECSTCGQCEVVCPAHIETVTLWEELRRILVQADYGPLEVQKTLVKSVKAFDNPWQQPRTGRTKWARRAKKDGLIRELPREIRKSKGKVLLFFGCTAAYDVNVKQVAINTINILEALDIDYGILGAEEKCCASVLLRMGDPEHKRVFKENIDLFNSLGIETLISSCSGCFKTILQDYPRVAPLNFEVLHTAEFLARMLKNGELKFPHPVNRTVTYHDPCHLGRATGGFDGPRMLMDAIPGLSLNEMPRNREYSRCCGAGGGLKAGYPDIQNKMAQRRIREAEETGAENLVSSCPFCYQGLNIGITALESPLVMRDISSLVAESLLGYDVFEKASEAAGAKARDKEAKKAAREQARAEKKARKTTPPSTSAEPPVEQTAADDPMDAKAAKKAEKERKRAEKRAARKKAKPEKQTDETSAADLQNTAAASEKTETADAAAKADKKAEKERKRAEKRAARRQKKEAETVKAAAPVEEAAAEAETVPESAAEPVEPVKAPVSKEDKKAERERRKAEKRAAREKEKAARRAARS